MQSLWRTFTTGHICDDMFRIMLVHVTYVKRGKTQAVEKGPTWKDIWQVKSSSESLSTLLDHFRSHGNLYIFVVADYISKFMEIFPLPNIEAETV